MNRPERTYSQLFELLRETPQAATLSPGEIQSLIEQPPGKPAPATVRFSWTPVTRRIAIVAALAISAIGVWQLGGSTPESDRRTGPVPSPQTAGLSAHPAPKTSPAQTPQPAAHQEASVAPTGTNTAPAIQHGAPRTLPVKSITNSPSLANARRTQPMRVAEDSIANVIGTQNTVPKHPEISTIPMLELSTGELEALGVTFANGGIQTIGEEYYTLANEQDRKMFAQMGMDTLYRTGIVQMRLVIDTFGLTTKKYPWTRVDTYSRIAPVIALNSYVKNDHEGAVTLNSFTHSPIMDSAKRSVGYAVDVLAKMLASDNMDRMMHDSDQANPARILVPVHIRMGDQPIGGSTRRRGADVILWYYPTPEFVAALPARYRISLQKELNAIADVVECNLPPGEACRQMTGELSLLNYCKRASGALRALNVTPNPAHGSVMVRYMLESERTIVATLYGLHGEYIRELIPSVTMGTGTHSTRVQLGTVPSGAYIVVLRSEHGEQVSERLIVQ